MGNKQSSHIKRKQSNSKCKSRTSSLSSNLSHNKSSNGITTDNMVNTNRKSSIGSRVLGSMVFGSNADIVGRSMASSKDEKGDVISTSLLAAFAQDQDVENNAGGKATYSTESKEGKEKEKKKHMRTITGSFSTTKQISQIEAIDPSKLRTLPINLLDGTTWALRYSHETDKLKHVMIRTRQVHGLKYDGQFSFFVVQDGLISGELLPVDEEQLVTQEIFNWNAEQQNHDFLFEGGGLIRSKHIVLRRRIYLKNCLETSEALMASNVSSMAHSLAFIDACYTFRRGWYHQNEEQLVELCALMYNALRLHLHMGTVFDTNLCLNEVLPQIVVSQTTPELLDMLLQAVHSKWKSGVGQLTDLQSEQIFNHKLSQWCPWYGSIIFSITEHTADHKNNFKYLAATEDGIYVLTRSRSTAAVSLDTVHTWYAIEVEKYVPWSGVESWSCNGNGTCITVAMLQDDEDSSETKTNNAEKNGIHDRWREADSAVVQIDDWIYDTKEGNAVSIIDQFIEYSSVKQLAEAAEAEAAESTESTETTETTETEFKQHARDANEPITHEVEELG